jgi:hypothetical protein
MVKFLQGYYHASEEELFQLMVIDTFEKVQSERRAEKEKGAAKPVGQNEDQEPLPSPTRILAELKEALPPTYEEFLEKSREEVSDPWDEPAHAELRRYLEEREANPTSTVRNARAVFYMILKRWASPSKEKSRESESLGKADHDAKEGEEVTFLYDPLENIFCTTCGGKLVRTKVKHQVWCDTCNTQVRLFSKIRGKNEDTEYQPDVEHMEARLRELRGEPEPSPTPPNVDRTDEKTEEGEQPRRIKNRPALSEKQERLRRDPSSPGNDCNY